MNGYRIEQLKEQGYGDVARHIKMLEEALMDATAHLTAAASAYRKYAKRAPSLGRSYPDPFFSTRADDFDKAADRARKAALKSA